LQIARAVVRVKVWNIPAAIRMKVMLLTGSSHGELQKNSFKYVLFVASHKDGVCLPQVFLVKKFTCIFRGFNLNKFANIYFFKTQLSSLLFNCSVYMAAYWCDNLQCFENGIDEKN
jgi:hypothetical protein